MAGRRCTRVTSGALPRLVVTAMAMAVAGAGGCGSDSLPSFGATAVELGVLPQSEKIQGRDGGPSGLAWGRSVWTFGDTVLASPDERGSSWHHNSFAITDDLDASDNIAGFEDRPDSAGAPRPFIDATSDEDAFNVAHQGDPCSVAPCGARWAVWPGAPIWDEPRNRALVFYGLIYAEPGDFNFRGVGSSVAVWDDPAAQPQRPVLPNPDAPHPTLLFGEHEPAWGTAAVIEGDLLFVFACDGDPFAPPCSLARVPAADVLERGAWRFWDGATWSATMAGRKPLFTGAPSVSVGYNAHLGAWTAIYARPLSNEVAIRTAPALVGPWSSPRRLFTASKKNGGAYDAQWHREYDQEGGKVLYVTFSRSTGIGWFGAEFALVRVTLP